jgi:hypothetical protein
MLKSWETQEQAWSILPKKGSRYALKTIGCILHTCVLIKIVLKNQPIYHICMTTGSRLFRKFSVSCSYCSACCFTRESGSVFNQTRISSDHWWHLCLCKDKMSNSVDLHTSVYYFCETTNLFWHLRIEYCSLPLITLICLSIPCFL